MDTYAVTNPWDDGSGLLDALGGPVPTALERIETFMAHLNDEQREAVSQTEGAILVVAGAGTGKTRVLTSRIALLIERGHAKPSEILAVTFTNKAAAEMRTRIIGMVGERARDIRMGSFHAISLVMLRHHPRAAGLRDDRFAIPDEAEQRKLMEDVIADLGISCEDEDEAPGGRRRKASKAWKDLVKQEFDRIQSWKEEGWSLDIVEGKVDTSDEEIRRSLKIYRAYQEALLARNACDFADLLLHMVRLFREVPEIRDYWASKFRYILVDEFQDTNRLQYEWLEHLARGHGNICVVGDPDQSIYEWRGARPQLLLDFPKDWPGSRVVTVDRNYRSTQEILDVANAVVADNPRPVPKRLRSDRRGDPVRLDVYDTDWEEARAIVTDIKHRILNGRRAGDIAVLFRSASLMRPIEQRLIEAGIAYTVTGGMKFHEREEVKDALAYLRLAIDPSDEFAFLRVVNKPARGIGDVTAQQVTDCYRSGRVESFADACRYVAKNGQRIRAAARLALEQFAAFIEEIGGYAQTASKPGDLAEMIMTQVGYIAWRIAIDDEDVREREESLEELYRDANEYPDVASYLQQMALLSAQDIKSAYDTVRLSTIHAAKGLEFGVVYTPGLEDGILPNARSMRESIGGLAEERRIAHVGWTRAKELLIVSYARSRHYQATTPSPFLYDAKLIVDDDRPAPSQPQRTPVPAGGFAIRRGLRPAASAPAPRPRFWSAAD